MSNRLQYSSSPYLLQHAENPVDWYPWGPEALARARAEDRPIFLSIGYAACHWCHVMAHESFEDPAIAAILNAGFVSIKVDREERPDLDRIYMAAVQAIAGNGGWPMSVFLTPEGRPFYGGTYFPPRPLHGLPSFRQVLEAVGAAWRDRRDEVERGGAELAEAIARAMGGAPETGSPPPETPTAGTLREETLANARRQLAAAYDAAHGGWAGAPKFPNAMAIEYLLRHQHRSGDTAVLAMATDTLEAMARGGIYDQVGGGFHRYAVDDAWRVPHFEKMLYDNAQLARVYLHAWQATGRPLFRAVAVETLDYMLREMALPEGGLCASQDADAAGREGGTYLWTEDELWALLEEDTTTFLRAYPPDAAGRVEDGLVLTWRGSDAERAALAPLRERLLAARRARPQPARDDKVVAAWNGLALAALSEAGAALARPDYLAAARALAEFILTHLRTPAGRLYRTWRAGHSGVPGFLADYTHTIDGLLALYEATFETRWYSAATELAAQVEAHFVAPGGFYDTADDASDLIVRPRELEDNALPSGNAMAALAWQQLARLGLDEGRAARAAGMLAPMQSWIGRYPAGFSAWLLALDLALAPQEDVVVVGASQGGDVAELLAVARQFYAPYRLLAAGTLGDGAAGSGTLPALLRERPAVAGGAAAYVCRGRHCLPPVHTPAALRRLLAAESSP